MQKRMIYAALVAVTAMVGCSLDDVVDRGDSCPPRVYVDGDGNLVCVSIYGDSLSKTLCNFSGEMVAEAVRPDRNAYGEYIDDKGNVLFEDSIVEEYFQTNHKFPGISYIQGVCNDRDECLANDKYKEVFDFNVCPKDYPSCGFGNNEFFCKERTAQCQTESDCARIIRGWESGRCENKLCVVDSCLSGYSLVDGGCTSLCEGDNHMGATGVCEPNTVDACGSVGFSCKDNMSGWINGKCEDAKCVATHCEPGYTVIDGKCEADCISEVFCDNQCVNPNLDPVHCGARGLCTDEDPDSENYIGKKCENGFSCQDGECKEGCIKGQVLCNGKCISPDTDPVFCGARGECSEEDIASDNYKGKACESGTMCSQGVCSASCLAGQVYCGDKCVDPMSDPEFCGSTGSTTTCESNGESCESGMYCSGGSCDVSCLAGQVYCGGKCVDSSSDPKFCGAKGTTLSCIDNGAVCESGTVCTGGVCAASCLAGQVYCGGKCVDPLSDPVFCGARGTPTSCEWEGKRCVSGTVCSVGECQVSCLEGQVYCGGKCIDPMVDSQFCGATGTVSECISEGNRCDPGKICSGGECQTTCATGMTDCGGTCLDLDANHVASCDGQVLTCKSGYTDCDGIIGNGCEIYTDGDNAHCGTCTNSCPTGMVCAAGKCDTKCLSSQALCGGKCIDPQVNNSYCGAKTGGECSSSDESSVDYKGHSCGAGQTCSNGTCVCPEGQTFCKTGASTYACVDASNSNQFCGCSANDVGNKCESGMVCAAGSCSTSCLSSQALCGNKCIDPLTDNTYCGASTTGDCNSSDVSSPDYKGKSCGIGQTCESGECRCPSGQIYCKTGASTYACVDSDTNNQYCGCSIDNSGDVCGSGMVCSGGNCGTTCLSTQALCGGKCVDPLTDNAYCGAKTAGSCSSSDLSSENYKGEVCGTGQTCEDGFCQCPQGQTYCKTGASTYACVDADTSNQYCGCTKDSVGNACSSGMVCSGGSCGTSCLSTQALCGGKCIDPQNDNIYCGASTVGACSSNDKESVDYKGEICGTGQTCKNGFCQCPEGQTYCKTGASTYACVDASTSNQYCGCSKDSVGNACSSGKVCSGGICDTSCLESQALCGGKCIDPQKDGTYCGALTAGKCNSSDKLSADYKGEVCGTGQTCSGGICMCPQGQTYCKTGASTYACVDANNSNQYCGCRSEWAGKTCASGEVCLLGSCEASCLSSQLLCGNKCIDPQTDDSYCGAKKGGACNSTDEQSDNYRGVVCGIGQKCEGGVCRCPEGQTYCKTGASTYACIDASNSNLYCGCNEESVGANCTSSQQICSSSKCETGCVGTTKLCKGVCLDFSTTHVKECNENTIRCSDGYADIDGSSSNGCEVNLSTDNNNCGDKGNVCTNGRTCMNGNCECPGELKYCKTGTSSFACVDASNSNQYCGCSEESMGKNCTDLGQFCTSSICKTSCSGATKLCKGVCLDFSATHVEDCREDSMTCMEGYADVDGKASNGCEVNLKTDDSNCGASGKVCTDGRTCTNGNCECPGELKYCKTGTSSFACVDASNSNQYCGCSEESMGKNCTDLGQFCTSSSCATNCAGATKLCKDTCLDFSATHVKDCNTTKIICMDDYADADGKASNGCEINLKTDNSNCGYIGNGCTNGRTCMNGSCECPGDLKYCKTGTSSFACVDASNSNQYCGCSEEDVGKNCTSSGQMCTSGSCATTCATGTELCKGTCIDKSATHVSSCTSDSITCESNYADVDGKVSNGCEVNLKTDNNNCGRKGNVCSNGRTCMDGVCDCSEGLTYCKTGTSSFACIDASNSNQYCGCSSDSMGKNCTNEGMLCMSSSCALNCAGSAKLCKGICLDIETTHVVACDDSSIKCVDGYADVDGKASNGCEVYLKTDDNNCGSVGNRCKNGQTCDGGTCQCPNGLTYCKTGTSSFACIDASNSNLYCGCSSDSMGKNCTNSGQFCSSSTCKTTCAGVTKLCKGICLDVETTHVIACDDSSIKCVDGYADVDGKASNGCEVDLMTDNNNCGRKGNICTNGQTCDGGTCQCPANQTYCKTGTSTYACLDASNNNQYCGCSEDYVGTNCLSNGQICTSSSCATTCANGTKLCRSICLDFSATHVKACENDVIKCEEDYADVDRKAANGCEVNLKSDNNNCGSLGNSCTDGRTCVNSKCVCPANQIYCKTGSSTHACLDASNNNQYCGCSEDKVGTNCLSSGQICSSGACATTCATGTALCKGTCIDMSATHVASCSDTTLSCMSDYADVDGKASNGCEVNLDTDNNNCGTKGHVCSNGQTCVSGNCSCPSGLRYCKTGTSTYACVDSSNSNQHCNCSENSMGVNCTSSGMICSMSACSVSCANGMKPCKGICLDISLNHVAYCDESKIECEKDYADVDGKPANGCEVNLNTDSNNCGTKGHICSNGQSCVNGKCSCLEGLTYCKTSTSTYACVDANNSNLYCGCTELEVGKNCTQIGKYCSSGSCELSCASGTDLCKGICLDRRANHVSSCTSSSITCESGYADIDGIAANGCEVNLMTDNNNCGTKGNVCSNGRTCEDGNCTCPSGLTYCLTSSGNVQPTYACIDATSSNRYCGCTEREVGKNCISMGQVCDRSVCATTCSSGMTLCKNVCIDKSATHVSSCTSTTINCVGGYADVDGNAANGCEVNLNTDNNNCGTAGNVCTDNRTCYGGNCICSSGLTYCKTGTSTYACVDSSNSNQYCGCTTSSVGTNCVQNGQYCTSSRCSTTCGSGTKLCLGVCLDWNLNHVAACDREITCMEGYADIDGKASNGCEVDLMTNNLHCGSNNATCKYGQTCIEGKCLCPGGLSLCKTGTSTYACIDASSSNQYCGCTTSSVGSACSSGQVCSGGSCSLSCQSGLTNCNGTCIDMTATHVGSCATSTILCVSGYGNCDGMVANGCEVRINGSDNSNCGRCNNTCAAGQYCSNGACVSASACPNGTYNCGGGCLPAMTLSALHMDIHCNCVSGWYDNNNDKADGCESKSASTDPLKDCGGVNCYELPGWKDGKCIDNHCVATACNKPYELNDDKYPSCYINYKCPEELKVNCSSLLSDGLYCCKEDKYCYSPDPEYCKEMEI